MKSAQEVVLLDDDCAKVKPRAFAILTVSYRFRLEPRRFQACFLGHTRT
jgi:hypothetical protein